MADDEMQTPDDDAAADADAPLNEEPAAEDAASEDAADAVDAAPEGDAPEAVDADAPEATDGDAPEAADGDAPEAADDDEPAAGGLPNLQAHLSGAGSEEISQEDIDALLAEQGDAPEPAEVQPAGGGATDVDAGAETLLGEHVAALGAFGLKGQETLSLGVESAMGQAITIANTSVVEGDYSAIEQEFVETPHLGFELRLSLSETESHLVAALIPLPDAGALFSIDTTPDEMADEGFAQTQLETAAGTMRELLDLVSLTLFTEGLSAAEVTLSDQRVDQPEFTMGIVADVAQGATPLRVDIVLALPGGIPVTVTLVIPSSLAIRIAETMAEADAAAPADLPEPTPIDSARGADGPAAVDIEAPPTFAGAAAAGDAAAGGAGFGAEEPLRPAATIGASPDVDVHPVRFPPLPELEPPVTAQRGLDLIMDVQMRVAVELGRSTMTVEDVLSLGPGSVVELNKLAGEAVDILVNERLIARGEVVVVDENFGVRVTEIVSPRRRAHAMGA